LSCWPRTGRQAPIPATIRQVPEDFLVWEVLDFEPSGSGEHCLVHLEKTGWATPALARQLAQLHGLPLVDVGYAGMKDKQAVTSQWFSLRGVDALAADLHSLDGVRVLGQTRHQQKLRRGQIASNRFSITLRDLGEADPEPGLADLRALGAPNYFGQQRFGADNLSVARRWLSRRRRSRVSRFKQGLYLSVLRSFLFNEVLGARVQRGDWHRLIDGDVLENQAPTGPLWGRGRSATGGAAAVVESGALARHQEILEGLEHAGLRQARRTLLLKAADLDWEQDGSDLKLDFSLATGGYATSFLGDLFAWRQPDATP
jgi:tRNA pseudouridine13 synthase